LVVSGEARLRSWFLRNLLEAAERELGTAALASLPSKVPARLRPHLSLDRLRSAVAVDGIPLDEGEEVLLALDQALGDGTGRMLERLSREMHARQLLQAKGTVRLGDLSGTVARLRGPLEHAFVDVEVLFELSRTELGFTLTVGVPGRPRATRALSHLAQGAIHAAERFAREGRETTRLYAEAFADRAVITLNLRRASEPPPPGFDPPTLRRPSIARVPVSLSDEVARESHLGPVPSVTGSEGHARLATLARLGGADDAGRVRRDSLEPRLGAPHAAGRRGVPATAPAVESAAFVPRHSDGHAATPVGDAAAARECRRSGEREQTSHLDPPSPPYVPTSAEQALSAPAARTRPPRRDCRNTRAARRRSPAR
jgi:hypothetical protein